MISVRWRAHATPHDAYSTMDLEDRIALRAISTDGR